MLRKRFRSLPTPDIKAPRVLTDWLADFQPVLRLKAALESASSLELGPKVLMVFEDYAKGNTSSSHAAHCKGLPGVLEAADTP